MGGEIAMPARNVGECEAEHKKLAGDFVEGLPRPGRESPTHEVAPLPSPARPGPTICSQPRVPIDHPRQLRALLDRQWGPTWSSSGSQNWPRMGGRKDLVEPTAISRPPWWAAWERVSECWPTAPLQPALGQRESAFVRRWPWKRQTCSQASNPLLG